MLTLAESSLALEGVTIPLDHVLGIPVVVLGIDRRQVRCFLDTGAQLSYLQSMPLDRFASTGRTSDFYPGIGTFETEIWDVALTLAGVPLRTRCGQLP